MQPSLPANISLFKSEQITTITTANASTTATTVATASSSPTSIPRLKIQTPSSNTSTSPASPRYKFPPCAVPKSPRLLSNKNSFLENQVENTNSDKKSAEAVSTLTLTPKSRVEKYDDNPPPYSPTDNYAQPSSPTKLTINFPNLEKNESETKEVLHSNEPVLTPRRNRIARHVATLRRNPTDVTEKNNVDQLTSPRATPIYTRETIISSFSAEITKSAIGGKSVSLDVIGTLGRVDAVFNIDELPDELQSFGKNSPDKKLSSTKLMRDLFSSEFKSSSSWGEAKKFIDGAKMMSDPTVKMGETDEEIKNTKSLILKPIAEDIARCLISETDLIADTALSNEFIEKFLFQADQKILEWALKSDALSVKEINLARGIFLYNLVVIRFLQPIIAAEFGDVPSQMDSWMQSLILNELKPNIFNKIKDFLEKSGKEMPEKLNLQLNAKASLELRNKRIAEIQKNNSAIKEKKSTFSKDEVLKTKEKNKLKNAEKNNLAILKEIKAKCGISDIGGKFSTYIESDIKEWLSLDVKMDRESIISNLNFSVYNYLVNNLRETDADENIPTIKNVSEILERLANADISDDVKRHTNFSGDDLKSAFSQDLARYELKLNSINDDNSGVTETKSGINFDLSGQGAIAFSPTTAATTQAVIAPTTTTTTTTTTKTVTTTADVASFTAARTMQNVDADFKESKN